MKTTGLIPNYPNSLQTILPQVLEFFPALMELDLSNNAIYFFANNGTPATAGMQALVTYLPQFTNLQSLKISNPLINIYGDDLDIYLQFPDLSYNTFLYAASLGKGLEDSHSLTSVKLASCCR